jgi:hypothetical protein
MMQAVGHCAATAPIHERLMRKSPFDAGCVVEYRVAKLVVDIEAWEVDQCGMPGVTV